MKRKYAGSLAVIAAFILVLSVCGVSGFFVALLVVAAVVPQG
ncbi:hypothetical protein [Arthrobacter sp. M4]|nr:hypothetical protein [Arthrobacter sp. M4]